MPLQRRCQRWFYDVDSGFNTQAKVVKHDLAHEDIFGVNISISDMINEKIYAFI